MLQVSRKTEEATGMTAAEIEAVVRRMNADGRNDREISRALGLAWGTVQSIRKRLGLPANIRRTARGNYAGREESLLGDMRDCGWNGEPVRIVVAPGEKWCTYCGVPGGAFDYCERCGKKDLVPVKEILMPWEYEVRRG